MAEANANATTAGLDRIERILEQTVITLDRVADKVDYVANEMKGLLRAQVIMQERQDKSDERVDKLVSAIGALIAQRDR